MGQEVHMFFGLVRSSLQRLGPKFLQGLGRGGTVVVSSTAWQSIGSIMMLSALGIIDKWVAGALSFAGPVGQVCGRRCCRVQHTAYCLEGVVGAEETIGWAMNKRLNDLGRDLLACMIDTTIMLAATSVKWVYVWHLFGHWC
jgi:hypothetical protein